MICLPRMWLMTGIGWMPYRWLCLFLPNWGQLKKMNGISGACTKCICLPVTSMAAVKRVADFRFLILKTGFGIAIITMTLRTWI